MLLPLLPRVKLYGNGAVGHLYTVAGGGGR